MFEQLKYRNHQNEVFEFGKDGIFVNTSELHDYEWTVTKRGNRISALDYSVVNRKLPIIIMCGSEEDGLAARNKLMEVTEKDVLALQHGRILIGDYYFRCYVTKSQKVEYLLSKRYMKLTLTLTSDFPYWVKETTAGFGTIGTGGASGGKNLDFSFDYPFDYHTNKTDMNNTGFVATNFKMVIYGACTNPAVYISGHLYQVNCEVLANEYLTIDSTSKKVYVTANDGTIRNVFNLRNRDSYIFEKIPPGKNTVLVEGEFGVDLTFFEERSEPKWT